MNDLEVECRLKAIEDSVETLKEIVYNLRDENEDYKEAFEITDDSVHNIRISLANINNACSEMRAYRATPR